MEGDRCGGSSGGGGGSGNYILNKDFSDGSITSGGWLNFWSGASSLALRGGGPAGSASGPPAKLRSKSFRREKLVYLKSGSRYYFLS